MSSAALRVFLPFAFGYYMSYVYRAITAVMAPDLVHDLALDPSALGFLNSTYYLTFALAQLPLGILLDRVGPRRTEAALLLVAAAGSVIFSLAPTFPVLAIGRGLIGLGVSVCLMGAATAFARSFPRDKLAFANGCVFASGGLGAITATMPVEWAMTFTDWRGVFLILAAMTAAAALVLFFVAPEQPLDKKPRALKEEFAGFGEILRHPTVVRFIPLSILTQSVSLSIPTLWSGPWFHDVAGFSREDVASALMMQSIGLMIGFFTWGAVAGRLNRRGIPTMQTFVGAILIYLALQVVLIGGWIDMSSQFWPRSVWVLYTFTGCSGSLGYAALSQEFPTNIAGRVNTLLNLFVFAGAFAAQWGVGVMINLYPLAADGSFSPDGYRAAFIIMLAIELVGLVWIPLSGLIFKTRPAHDIRPL